MTENGSGDAGERDGEEAKSEADEYDEGAEPRENDRADEPLADLLDEIDDRREPQVDREPVDGPVERTPVDELGDPDSTDQGGSASEVEAATERSDSPGEGDEGRRAGPLGAVADAIDERRARDESVDDGLFAEEEIPEVDAEVVWTQLEEGGPVAPPSPDREEIRTVEKATHCERCEYFSAPPEMHCTHDGTEIRELVDVDHVRVVNCPVVRENEELEKL